MFLIVSEVVWIFFDLFFWICSFSGGLYIPLSQFILVNRL
jgi:hypothetical protein